MRGSGLQVHGSGLRMRGSAEEERVQDAGIAASEQRMLGSGGGGVQDSGIAAFEMRMRGSGTPNAGIGGSEYEDPGSKSGDPAPNAGIGGGRGFQDAGIAAFEVSMRGSVGGPRMRGSGAPSLFLSAIVPTRGLFKPDQCLCCTTLAFLYKQSTHYLRYP